MKFYIDFSAPTAREFSDLYLQLHLMLKENKDGLAVSFPNYMPKTQQGKGSVGLIIRLLSYDKVSLEKINIYGDIIREKNNSTFTDILPVPETVICHAIFSRSKRRTQSHLRRIAKRSVEFGRAENEQEIIQALQNLDRSNPNPCVTLRSLSTKQRFPLHIEVKAKPNAKAGRFCSYGLSREATVPIF